MPFNLNSKTNPWSNFPEYSIGCFVGTSESDSDKFTDFLDKLDTQIETSIKNNISLFNGASDNFIYSKLYRDNKTYPKILNLNFKRDKDGNFTSFIFGENKEKLRLSDNNIEDYFKKGASFKCIIECTKLWTYDGKIGSSWSITQLKFIKNKQISHDTSSDTNTIYDSIMIED